MWPERVVLMPPALDQDLGLEQRIEELAIEKLGAEFPVERFDIAILPWASGLDEQSAHADLTQPLSDRSRREFRSVVRPDMRRCPALYEEVRKALQDVLRLQSPRHHDRQAFAGELIDHHQHAELSAIVGRIFDEIVGPHVVLVLRPQTETRAIVEP